MKRLLIVEDEKMIRKGIRAIAERSGVLIEEIIEARNGVEAYAYLSSHKVDLMLTDIQMPKMNGVLLVQKLKEEHRLPKVIVISGYDDFQYATEVMRCGASDYLLKPVDMDQVIVLLQKMDHEIEQEKCQLEKLRTLELKNLFEQKQESNSLLEKQFAEFFQEEQLVVICTPVPLEPMIAEALWVMEEEDGFCLIMRQDMCVAETLRKVVGISEPFQRFEDITRSYEQAKQNRKLQFLQQRENVLQEKENILDENQMIMQIQMIGTSKFAVCIEFMRKLLWDAQNGKYTAESYVQAMTFIAVYVEEQYATILPVEERMSSRVLSCINAKAYLDELEVYLEKLHNLILKNCDEYKNQIKMKETIQYLRDNYTKELNMAEVANQMGISYSWFSTVFKQYAGMSFVSYLKTMRLEEAKKLLHTTDWKIQEISRKVGYENEVHFMKIFKTMCGVSPSEYRKVCNGMKEAKQCENSKNKRG